jgi:hypothetical protein
MASYTGDGVNMVFVGCTNAPESHCGADGGLPRTTADATPLIAEKPYITLEGDKYKLNRPHVEANKKGSTPNWNNTDVVDFSQVYVAHPDHANMINEKLA